MFVRINSHTINVQRIALVTRRKNASFEIHVDGAPEPIIVGVRQERRIELYENLMEAIAKSAGLSVLE